MSISAIQGNYNNTFRNTGFNNYGFTTGTIYPNSTPLPSDTVEISGKKKGLTKKQKFVTGAVVTGALTAAVLLMRGKVGAANKEIKALAEHIDFAPAKTIEEAINFAKTNLGIKKYSNNMPLDVMNWVNEGLVNVNNATKGKAKMPNIIRYEKNGEDEIAHMAIGAAGIKRKEFSRLTINSVYIERLDNNIEKWMQAFLDKRLIGKTKDGKLGLRKIFIADKDSNYGNWIKNLNKFAENPKNVSITDKMEIARGFTQMQDGLNQFAYSPRKIYDQLIKYKDCRKYLPNSTEFAKMSTKEQSNCIWESIKKSGGLYVGLPHINKFNTIYHEMGHLQHRHSAGLDLYKKMGAPAECEKMFGKVTDITKDFINSQEKQQTAFSVSDYAQTSPLEFVAETYAELIQSTLHGGKKLPDDVMKLYAEYKGPAL